MASTILRRSVAGVVAVAVASALAQSPTAADGVLWGDRMFKTDGELAVWLSARGVAYEHWAERHPEAAAQLEGRPPAAPVRRPPSEIRRTTPEQGGTQATVGGERNPAAAVRAPETRTSPLLPSIVVPLIGLALLLVALVVPNRRLAGLGWVAEHRVAAAAAGGSIVVGGSLGLAIAFAF